MRFLLQIENRNGGLVYVVDFKEKMIDATPVDVATAIYKQMKGYILVSTFLRFTVYFSLEIADKIHTNQFMHIPISTVQNRSWSLFEFVETANSHGDGDIHDSVLAVPSQFSEEQRKAFGYEMTM